MKKCILLSIVAILLTSCLNSEIENNEIDPDLDKELVLEEDYDLNMQNELRQDLPEEEFGVEEEVLEKEIEKEREKEIESQPDDQIDIVYKYGVKLNFLEKNKVFSGYNPSIFYQLTSLGNSVSLFGLYKDKQYLIEKDIPVGLKSKKMPVFFWNKYSGVASLLSFDWGFLNYFFVDIKTSSVLKIEEIYSNLLYVFSKDGKVYEIKLNMSGNCDCSEALVSLAGSIHVNNKKAFEFPSPMKKISCNKLEDIGECEIPKVPLVFESVNSSLDRVYFSLKAVNELENKSWKEYFEFNLVTGDLLSVNEANVEWYK